MRTIESSPIVLTIGHSTRTLEAFIGLLQAHGNLCGGCADGAAIPSQRAVQQDFTATLIEESRVALRPSAGTRRAAVCSARFGQHRLAQCVLPRVCGLYADAGICAEPRRTHPVDEPGTNRLDVRRSSAVALSSFAHRRCLIDSRNSYGGHHEYYAPAGSYSHALCSGSWEHDHLPG